MKVLEHDETTCKGHAFAAWKDALGQNLANWDKFSKTKIDIAHRLQQLCHAAYFESKTYINARDKFIAVKVEKPKPSAAWLYPAELKALREYAEKIGVEPIATKTSLIFRITK